MTVSSVVMGKEESQRNNGLRINLLRSCDSSPAICGQQLIKRSSSVWFHMCRVGMVFRL